MTAYSNRIVKILLDATGKVVASEAPGVKVGMYPTPEFLRKGRFLPINATTI